MSSVSDDVRDDFFVKNLLEKLPSDSRGSFSADQLLALKVAFGGRAWGVHAVDLRWTLKIWRWHYYFVVLAGRNRRELSRREREIARVAMVLSLAIFLVFSALLGLLMLYLVKSAFGINLFPGFSLGIWGWFQESILR
ncbi:hypothetical protein [Azonexus sp. R2A61]|uniref:hypothetical protein n=1 Tax=Azonexus sp. R2A61 TaxID=2744443 RepID=UPI001F407D35|nr:hypothetical protein [Azonexus sp. R2A61]